MWDCESRRLIFGETNYSFSGELSVNACFHKYKRKDGIMLKIVYPVCCGLDARRDFVFACIATTENGATTYKCHRFSNLTKGLRELLSGLLLKNCKDVCMESTEKYWIPVYNILETDCKIVLTHPKYVKAIASGCGSLSYETDKLHYK